MQRKMHRKKYLEIGFTICLQLHSFTRNTNTCKCAPGACERPKINALQRDSLNVCCFFFVALRIASGTHAIIYYFCWMTKSKNVEQMWCTLGVCVRPLSRRCRRWRWALFDTLRWCSLSYWKVEKRRRNHIFESSVYLYLLNNIWNDFLLFLLFS